MPFIKEANRLRNEHRQEFPGYKYQPKRKNRARVSANSYPAPMPGEISSQHHHHHQLIHSSHPSHNHHQHVRHQHLAVGPSSSPYRDSLIHSSSASSSRASVMPPHAAADNSTRLHENNNNNLMGTPFNTMENLPFMLENLAAYLNPSQATTLGNEYFASNQFNTPTTATNSPRSSTYSTQFSNYESVLDLLNNYKQNLMQNPYVNPQQYQAPQHNDSFLFSSTNQDNSNIFNMVQNLLAK